MRWYEGRLQSTHEMAMIGVPSESLGLDSFYRKYSDAGGIPIVSPRSECPMPLFS